MSQLSKHLEILDLFDETRPGIAAQDVVDRLGIARTSAFRYLRQLCEVGLLSRMSRRYVLGARIIQLDYKIRSHDPLVRCARDPLRNLAAVTWCPALLASCYGEQIVTVHCEGEDIASPFVISRGQTLPLLRGATSKVIVANFPLRKLRRIHARLANHPDTVAIGAAWGEFARSLRDIRRQGYCASQGEVTTGAIGVAAPVFSAEGHVIASITVFVKSWRDSVFDEASLAKKVCDCAGEVTARLRALSTLDDWGDRRTVTAGDATAAKRGTRGPRAAKRAKEAV